MKGLMKGKLRINIRAKILGTLRCRLSVKRQGRRRKEASVTVWTTYD